MIITLHNIAKRFNYDWIFRHINLTLETDQVYACIGPNGSGKSTLLKIIAGQLTPSEGNMDFTPYTTETFYEHVTYAAPYLDLLEEFTLVETVAFQSAFKPWRNGLIDADVIALSGLEKHKHKRIKTYSSGMRQRVKLILAICANSELLILDEPTTNLDHTAVEWYHNLLQTHRTNRIVVIGSNLEREYPDYNALIDLMKYKQGLA